MRLRTPELLAERGWSAYDLAKKLEPHGISPSTAYRLARGPFTEVSARTLEALCRVFGIKDPGPLLARGTRDAEGRR